MARVKFEPGQVIEPAYPKCRTVILRPCGFCETHQCPTWLCLVTAPRGELLELDFCESVLEASP